MSIITLYASFANPGCVVLARYITDLMREVSRPRLTRYKPHGASDLEMAVNYFWNMTLAEALHPSLAALEIGLRNSIHNALARHYGTDMWFRQHDFVSNHNLNRELNRVIGKLGRPAAQPTAGRIVAELPFSYWTTILSRDFHQLLWNPNNAALLREVFPHLHGPGFRRVHIHQRYNRIRIFRNRVMHNEPLLYGFTVPGQPTVAIVTMHADINEALGWVSPQLQASLGLIDRFPAVHSTGRASIEIALKRHLGIS